MHRAGFRIALGLALAAPLTVVAQDWQAIGPEGGPLLALQVPDPAGQRAFALGQGGLYRSDDRGATWSLLPGPGPGFQWGPYSRLAVSAADPDAVVLLDTASVHRSTDAGLSWSALPVAFDEVPLEPDQFTAVAVDPLDAERIAVFRTFRAGGSTRLSFLWQTEDGATTAIAQSVPSGDARCAGPVPSALDRVYAAAFVNGQLLYSHLYDCTVSGIHFPPVPDRLQARLHAWGGGLTAVFRGELYQTGLLPAGEIVSRPPHLFARTLGHVLRVDPQTSAQTTVRGSSQGLVGFADGSLVSGESSELLRSTDAGATWSRIDGPSAGLTGASAPFPIHAASFLAPARWLAGNHDGVFASTDLGASWQFSSSGLTSLLVRALAVDPGDAGRIWVGIGEPPTLYGSEQSSGRVLYRTGDGGASWSLPSIPIPVMYLRALALDPATLGDPGQSVVYASGRGCFPGGLCLPGTSQGQGIFKSMDGGATWNQLASSLAGAATNPALLRGIAIDSASGTPQSRTVLVTHSLSRLGSLVARSADAGGSWSSAIQGLPTAQNGVSSESMVVAFAPSQPGRAYLASYSYPSHSSFVPHEAGVFRSDDGGLNWSLRSGGLPAHPGGTAGYGATALAVDADNADRVWALSYELDADTGRYVNRVFRTVDGGLAWSERGSGLPVADFRAIAVDPDDPAFVCVAGVPGVYCSMDDGGSWSPLGNTRWSALALVIAARQVFAGTRNGVIRIPRPGAADEGILRRLRGRLGVTADGGAAPTLPAGGRR